MVTTWPQHFPILGEGADLLAKWIDEMSGGQLKITVYGGGELIPPLEGFDAVTQGTIEMCHGAAYYWAGKAPATQFFAAVPFGMNGQQLNAWIYRRRGVGTLAGTICPVQPYRDARGQYRRSNGRLVQSGNEQYRRFSRPEDADPRASVAR